MLKQKYRVRKQKEYDEIFARNQKLRSTNFMVLVHFNDKLKTPKFGIIVSSKVGNAVVRNKVKRRIRELIHSNIDSFQANAEYVFITFPQISNLDFPTLKTEFENILFHPKSDI